MRFKQFLESAQYPDGTPADIPAPYKVGDRVFSKFEQHVGYFTEVDGKKRAYSVLVNEGDEFVIDHAEWLGGYVYVFIKTDEGTMFDVLQSQLKTNFGPGTWKDYKKNWINSLKEEYEWMDWNDVHVGGEYTKVDDVMPMVGHHKDWKETYERLGEKAREVLPKGTKITVTAIIDERPAGPFVEFKTADGKQYFLADDAFVFNFYNGSLRDWRLRFFHDIGLPKDDDHLKEDGRFKRQAELKTGDVRTVTTAQALRGELPNGKSHWFRAGNKLTITMDKGEFVWVSSTQRSRVTVPKADFLKYTVPEADYKGSKGYVKEDGAFKRMKQYKPLERGQELKAKKQFHADMEGRQVEIRAGANLRFVREVGEQIVFKATGRRYATFTNENKFLTAKKWEFLAACGEEIEG